jgi:hypothetical protein
MLVQYNLGAYNGAELVAGIIYRILWGKCGKWPLGRPRWRWEITLLCISEIIDCVETMGCGWKWARIVSIARTAVEIFGFYQRVGYCFIYLFCVPKFGSEMVSQLGSTVATSLEIMKYK